MKIAILCPDASSNALVRTYPIAKVLERRHEIDVVGFRFGKEVFEPYRDEFRYRTVAASRLPGFLAQVREMARSIEADAIYAFKPLPSSLWAGLLAKRRLGVPLFLDVEDWETGWYLDVPPADAVRHLLHVERPNGFLWTWLTELAVRGADEVFVVSRPLKERFGGTLLPHGADTRWFDPTRWEREDARRRIGLSAGRYVAFTGSPSPQKGLDDLCEAVRRIGDRSLRVLVVGSFRHSPGYRRALEERYAAELVIFDSRPHSEMPLFLAAADVVALPQRRCRATQAQVPGKVFEAMAMAKPIVATAVSDLPEILADSGRIVAPGSIESLCEAVQGLVERPPEARMLGEAARRRCIERYSWDAMEKILDERLSRWLPERRKGLAACAGS